MNGEGFPRSEDELLDELAHLLRRLPAGMVIHWGDDASGDEPVLTGSLCVWAPEIARPLGLNWIWTIDTREGYRRLDPEAGPGPLNLLVPYDVTDAAGHEGWRPELVNQVLQDWLVAHSGRSDLRFRFDPELMSDVVRELIDGGGELSAPVAEDPDGVLHDLVETGTQLWTRCGLEVAPSWGMRTAELWISEEMIEDDIGRELLRGCSACGSATDSGSEGSLS
ncbi:MAG: hypothetical protein H0V19_06505 [Euzebyales bacterium]|nr:hypothetical protein [Euzebyales bacterium]